MASTLTLNSDSTISRCDRREKSKLTINNTAMKNKSVKIIGLLSLLVVSCSSCTKKFDELNTDPTAYSQSNFDPNYLLTTSQLAYTGSFDFSYETWRGNLIYSSTLMQQLSTVIGYWAGDKYLLNEG